MATPSTQQLQKVKTLQAQQDVKLAAFKRDGNAANLVGAAQTQQEIIAILIGLLKGASPSPELSMIELQSLMSQRALAMQMTSNIMKSLNDTTKGIISNIR